MKMKKNKKTEELIKVNKGSHKNQMNKIDFKYKIEWNPHIYKSLRITDDPHAFNWM